MILKLFKFSGSEACNGTELCRQVLNTFVAKLSRNFRKVELII